MEAEFIRENLARQVVSSLNATDSPATRPARAPLRWAIYLMAIAIASFGWIAFLAYCALALLGY